MRRKRNRPILINQQRVATQPRQPEEQQEPILANGRNDAGERKREPTQAATKKQEERRSANSRQLAFASKRWSFLAGRNQTDTGDEREALEQRGADEEAAPSGGDRSARGKTAGSWQEEEASEVEQALVESIVNFFKNQK